MDEKNQKIVKQRLAELMKKVYKYCPQEEQTQKVESGTTSDDLLKMLLVQK